jgi:hypothetical protein
MNCSDFEAVVNDLAREQLLDAAQRTSGLAHAEGCARCASRLREERALTEGLRALAAGGAQAQAPARIEAVLLSAFRERNKVILLKPASGATSFAGRSRWAGAAVAAAVALLFISAAALYMRRSTQPQPVATARDSQPLKPAPQPQVSPSRDEPVKRPEPAASPLERGLTPQLAFERVSGRRTHDALDGGRRRAASIETPQPVNVAANSTEGDIATDFIPLSYGADLSSMDSGRVVRVELPRTALARYGLPMNAERAGEPVKADVLLGEDGLAQAIRFIK